MTKDIKSVQDQLTREMKEELQGISVAQDAMKEVMQERLSAMETRMDSFEDKVNFVRDDLTTMHNKVTLFEAKMTQMEENFERKIRENMEKGLKHQFEKEMKEKLEMEIREKVPEKYNETLEKMNKKIESFEKQVSNEEAKMPLMPCQATIKSSTFKGKIPWQVYKTQFTMVVEGNGWSPSGKTFHLAASLRGNAADILETLSEAQRHNFYSLSSALEL